MCAAIGVINDEDDDDDDDEMMMIQERKIGLASCPRRRGSGDSRNCPLNFSLSENFLVLQFLSQNTKLVGAEIENPPFWGNLRAKLNF